MIVMLILCFIHSCIFKILQTRYIYGTKVQSRSLGIESLDAIG
jgi:hypothetical protein